MSSVIRTIFFVFAFSFAGLASAETSVCDADSDGDIDIRDIQLIVAARNQPAAGPLDPRDADGDGVITVLDARACTLACTLPGCAEPPPNNAPIADAGEDRTVDAGDTVQLDGSASSDADGDPLTFSWSITSGPAGSAASLSDTSAVFPTFVADLAGEYRVELRVNDGKADSAPDEVIVTTLQRNQPPIAEAGPDQTVLIGDTVLLDGSASSDADFDPLTFGWTLSTVPAGSAATLDDPALVNPSFFVDLPGDYVAELIVNDGLAASAPDKVTISTANSRPVADAGPDQSVAAGEPAQLDGSGSFDADLDPLTFSWSLTTVPAGSAAALDDRTVPSPTLTTDLAGAYVAQLIVNDGSVDSAADTVVVVARDDSAPTAVLRLQDANGAPLVNNRVPFGADFRLDGSQSVDNGGGSIASYRWDLPGGLGTFVTTAPTVAISQLIGSQPLPVGQHVISLRVSDDSGNLSAPVQVVLVVFDAVAPTAVLRLQDVNGAPLVNNRVPFGVDFRLDGSQSVDGGGGRIASYRWELPGGLGAFLTTAPNIALSQLIGAQNLPVGQHVIGLRVTDDSGNQSVPAQVAVTVFVGFPP